MSGALEVVAVFFGIINKVVSKRYFFLYSNP